MAGVLRFLGWLPPRLVRGACAALAASSYWLWPRLRRVGIFNLRLAFPEWGERRRRRVLFGTFQNLGRMLADFARFPKLDRHNIEELIVYDGFEHFARAREQGKGVLFLTAHFGNWELSSFAHGLYGYPLNFAVREMDNPLLNDLINRYRCRSGGRTIEKNDFARQALRALRRGEALGILMDTNMLASEGVFVDFFGRLACTTTGPARIARKAGAPLVLGLAIWDSKLGKYRLRFEPVQWVARPDLEAGPACPLPAMDGLTRESGSRLVVGHERHPGSGGLPSAALHRRLCRPRRWCPRAACGPASTRTAAPAARQDHRGRRR